MSHLQNPRIRVVLIITLLAIIGAAGYQIGMNAWAGYEYREACQALQRYDYDQAGLLLKQYLAKHPTDTTALVLAAQTARRRNDFEEAARHLHLAQKHGAPLEAIAMEQRLLAVQAGDLSEAGALTQFCEEHPDGPETALILESLIEGSLRTFNLSLAKWSVETWLSHRPDIADQVQGLLWHGRLSEFSQNFPQAIADYKQAVVLMPNHLPAQLRLVEALIRDDPRQAVPYLEKLRQHHSENAEVRFQTARLRRNLGQPEEAAKLLDAILTATPDKVAVLVERGRVDLDMNRPLDAEQWLLRALSQAPEQREVHQALADCLRQAGRLEEAQRYQTKALEIEAKLQRLLDERAKKSEAKK